MSGFVDIIKQYFNSFLQNLTKEAGATKQGWNLQKV